MLNYDKFLWAMIGLLALLAAAACASASEAEAPRPVFERLPGAVTDVRRLPNGDLVAATDRGAGLFYSPDNGVTWRPGTGLGSQAGYALAELPGTQILLGATNLGIARSDDGGRSWSLAWVGTPGAFAVSVVGEGRPVAGVDAGAVVGDATGRRWERTEGRIEGSVLIAVAPLNGQSGSLLAAANNTGLWTTDDWGEDWRPVYPTRAVVSRLAAGPNGGWYGLAEGVLLHWVAPETEPEAMDLPAEAGVPLSLAIIGDRVLVGTVEGRVWAGGSSWQTVLDSENGVSALVVDEAELCWGTLSGGAGCRLLIDLGLG